MSNYHLLKVTKTCIQFNKIKVFIRTQSFNYSKRLLINYQTIKNSTKILHMSLENDHEQPVPIYPDLSMENDHEESLSIYPNLSLENNNEQSVSIYPNLSNLMESP
jgi:hypothetical protein